MQKRLLLREVLELLILSVAACALLLFPETASAAVVRGLRQCGAAILPSLFPFFICANLITELSLTRIEHITTTNQLVGSCTVKNGL